MKDFRALVKKGKSQGYIDYSEFKEFMPSEIVDEEQVEDIMQMLRDMGIEIKKAKAKVLDINSITNKN